MVEQCEEVLIALTPSPVVREKTIGRKIQKTWFVRNSESGHPYTPVETAFGKHKRDQDVVLYSLEELSRASANHVG